MHVERTPFDVINLIDSYTAKLNAGDAERTDAVIAHCREHIDLTSLIDEHAECVSE